MLCLLDFAFPTQIFEALSAKPQPDFTPSLLSNFGLFLDVHRLKMPENSLFHPNPEINIGSFQPQNLQWPRFQKEEIQK